MPLPITTLLFDFVNVLLLIKPNGYELNQPLIDFIKNHPKFRSHIFTSTTTERLAEIRGSLIPPFISIMSSKELHLPKDDPNSYRRVAELLKVSPEKIIFVDDKLWNVQAAQAAGLHAIHFVSTTDFIGQLERPLV